MNIVDQRPPSEGPLDDTINPRSPDEEATTRPIEDLVDLAVDDKKPTKVLKLGKNLPDERSPPFLCRTWMCFRGNIQTWRELTPQ